MISGVIKKSSATSLYSRFVIYSAFATLFCLIKFDSAVKQKYLGSRGGLMVSVLVSRSSGPGLSPGRGHCVVFLARTLYSHGASLHPGV